MATITGSGKYVQIANGRLRFGTSSESTLYADMYADSITYNGYVYQGITFGSVGYLNLPNLASLTVGDAEGYTGVISMCTNFNYPFSVLIWDPDEYENVVARSSSTFKKYRFEKGIMVGEVT